MRTLTTVATVTEEGTLVIPAPPDLSPGQHQVVVVIDERPASASSSRTPGAPAALLSLTPYPVGLVSDDFTFRREDLYNDG